MINKQNLLGKNPTKLGEKDAIHVAIVSVRAGAPLNPGQKCSLNEFGEAIPSDKGIGVVDPFLKSKVVIGQSFWLLVHQAEIPNVRHIWDHPKYEFGPPSRPAIENKVLASIASSIGVNYEQFIQDLTFVAEHDTPATYTGNKSLDDVREILSEEYDIWWEWVNETGHEFYNQGSECCPEYCFPECGIY